MNFFKKTLPSHVAFWSGLVVIFAFFSGPGFPQVKALEGELQKWAQIILSFAMILGVISLLQTNLTKVLRRAEGWGYNLTLVIGFLSMSTLGFISGFESNSSLHSWAVSFQQLFFIGLFNAAQATLFSLLAFFVASASFRAFRVKSFEAFLLMGTAFLVMIGNIPLGNFISSIFQAGGLDFINIVGMKEWVMSYPGSAAQSAILIGAALGYIAAGIKILMGIDRPYLGGEN